MTTVTQAKIAALRNVMTRIQAQQRQETIDGDLKRELCKQAQRAQFLVDELERGATRGA